MIWENIQQTFWQKTKRFFDPIFINKRVSLYWGIHFTIQWSFWVVFVLFVKDALNALEMLDQEIFSQVLHIYAVIFIVLLLLMWVCQSWWTYSYNTFCSSIEKNYLPQYINFDMNSYEKIWTGKSIAIISKWIKTWGWLLDRIMMECIGLILSLGVTIYLLFQVDVLLVFLLILLLVLGQFIWIYLNSKVILNRKKRIELDNLGSKQLVKIIMAKQEILQSEKIWIETQKLHKFHEWQILYNKKMSPYLVPFFTIGIIIVIILLFFVFIYFWNLYLKWEVSLGLIAGITGAILMMQNVFLNTLDFLKNFTKEFAEVQNMWNFFDTTPEIEGYEEWKTFNHISWAISLQNINYAYDESIPIFKNFTLDIPGNQITALVWPSGGWKSTLAKLISGYIRHDSWDICIDNQNLREVSLKSYYWDVGYLTQEPSVFDGTVQENLLYAVTRKLTKKYIEKIIILAHCEFIYDLPNGLQTEIWERGVKLSWGQKQRLAIAKIFLKDPKIIILDEPTSALDSLSEQKITEAMHNLFKGRTVIVIAHRLQTVKHADDIIVIEWWEIKERGTHASLVRKKWFYKQMLDLQSGF
jgi:ABC-type multidrug transport system fused ATPase/permease subunit